MTIWCNTCRCLVRAPCTSHRHHRPVDQRSSACRSFRSVLLFLLLVSPPQPLAAGSAHGRFSSVIALIRFICFQKRKKKRKDKKKALEEQAATSSQQTLSGCFCSVVGGQTDVIFPFVASDVGCPALCAPALDEAVKGRGGGQPPCVCDVHARRSPAAIKAAGGADGLRSRSQTLRLKDAGRRFSRSLGHLLSSPHLNDHALVQIHQRSIQSPAGPHQP